jgi:hypothetical protein
MWKHLRAILLLPGIVTLAIPGTIMWRAGTSSFRLWQSFPTASVGLPVIGAFCICLGLPLMVVTIRLFVTVGRGLLGLGGRWLLDLSHRAVATARKSAAVRMEIP